MNKQTIIYNKSIDPFRLVGPSKIPFETEGRTSALCVISFPVKQLFSREQNTKTSGFRSDENRMWLFKWCGNRAGIERPVHLENTSG